MNLSLAVAFSSSLPLAANGQIILTSEQYGAKDSALNGIESVQTNSPNDDRYERLTSKCGDPYFVLKAAKWADDRPQ